MQTMRTTAKSTMKPQTNKKTM